MVNKNIKFSNPIIKDEIEILHESSEKLIFRTYLEAGGGQANTHYHTKITEKFKVIEGELTVILNGEKRVLNSSTKAIVKPFDTHQFFNASGKAVIFEVEITPAQNIIKGLKIFYGLATDGKVYNNGLPKNIFYTAIGLQMLDAYVSNVPLRHQKIGVSILATIAKKIGVEQTLMSRYCN